MISFNEQILKDEGKYCIQIETDSEKDYKLIQSLIRGLIDDKICSVTVSSVRQDEEFIYVNGGSM